MAIEWVVAIVDRKTGEEILDDKPSESYNSCLTACAYLNGLTHTHYHYPAIATMKLLNLGVSANFVNMWYCEESQILRVQYYHPNHKTSPSLRGRIYDFVGVPVDIINDFKATYIAGKSVGSRLHHLVKKDSPFTYAVIREQD